MACVWRALILALALQLRNAGVKMCADPWSSLASCTPSLSSSSDPRQDGDGRVRVDIISHKRVLREDMLDVVSGWWEEVQMPHTRGVAVDVPNAYLVMSLQTSEKLQLQWIPVISVVSACGVDRPRPGGRESSSALYTLVRYSRVPLILHSAGQGEEGTGGVIEQSALHGRMGGQSWLE